MAEGEKKKREGEGATGGKVWYERAEYTFYSWERQRSFPESKQKLRKRGRKVERSQVRAR